MKFKRSNTVLLVATVTWTSLLTYIFSMLTIYAHTPGSQSKVSGAYPASCPINRQHGRPILLTFVASDCPCSFATISELERLMPALINKVDVWAIILEVGEPELLGSQHNLLRKIKKIPGVKAHVDNNNHLANLFDVQTSGQVLFYDHKGHLTFNGGITPSRGHMGDGRGRDFLLAWLRDNTIGTYSAKVFGCEVKL